jgi:hemin uptake protein HemP
MKITLTRRVVAIAAGLLLAATSTQAGVRVVNCDEGDSLQAAIDAGAGSAKNIEIDVFGTCEEDIRITRNGVLIVGDGATVIDGDVRLFNAGATLENLNFTGSSDGLRIIHSRARLRFVNVFGNAGYGIGVSQNGMLVCISCRIEYNVEQGVVLDNGSARLRNTIIEHNGGEGILVTNNGSLDLDGGQVNYHENGAGILATHSSSLKLSDTHIGWADTAGILLGLGSAGSMVNSHVNANANTGVVLENNSAFEVFGGGISWNGQYGALVQSHSTLNIIGAGVDQNGAHGIVVEHDGALFARDGARVFDNWAGDGVQIECRDKESSILLDGPVVDNPSTDVNCPDRDF